MYKTTKMPTGRSPDEERYVPELRKGFDDMLYVISDLHGYPFDKFLELLEKAGFGGNDFLMVLGDVIDRGADVVKYLEWLMRQKNADMLLGNHEAMLLSCHFLFEEVNEENLSKLSQRHLRLVYQWADNGGNLTMDSLLNLNYHKRLAIVEYLRKRSLYERFELNGKQYLLTHSGLRNFDSEKPLGEYDPDDFLWNRPQLTDRYYDDVTTVFGHTPSWFYGKEHEGKIIFTETWIDIDTGAGYGFSPVLLRLDDMKQFTI